MAKKEKSNDFINDVITPPGLAAFTHLSKPDTGGQYSDDKYKVRLLFDKGTDFKEFQKKVLICARRKFGPDIKLSQIQVPWTDGDERDDLDGHADRWYMNLKSKKRPTMVDRKKEDIDPEEIYAGCKIRCIVSLMPYEGSEVVVENGKKKRVGYKGVTCLLDLVQFLGHGEPFGGGSSAAKRELLDDLEDDEAGDVSLDDDDIDLGDDSGFDEEEEEELL